MANSFLNSLERMSSFAYHGEPDSRRSPIPQDIMNEPEIPLDAFDKELLAECPPEPSQRADYAHSPAYGQARISLPPRIIHASVTRVDSARTLRDDQYTTPVHTRESSTSSAPAVSSPTVTALQNRRSFQSSGAKDQSASKMGRARRDTEHPGAILMPEVEIFPQKVQEGTRPFQQRQAATTSRTQGGTTRMGLGHAPPIVQGIPLIAATELPDRYRSIFPFPVFNAVQSKCFSIAFGSKDNLVVSAPTGSGKTAVMELAICQLMHANKAGDFKVIYQAPTKSLCSERMRDWSGKFASLNLICAELTGDTEQSQLKNVQSASIIITTPEKWDSVTRKWKDNARLMKLVRLFLIDEVHILKESRGATLEAVVSRMKSVGSDVRFIALSATVPNSDDIAMWLGKAPDGEHLPAHRAVFGEDCRPVKLEKHVWTIRGPPNDFAFDKVLDTSVREAIIEYSRKKPTMIFCTTRKMAVDTAKMLARLFLASQTSHQLWPAPKKEYRMLDAELAKLVSAGVAFHHGGVESADRRTIEEGFLNSDISIICCTSTLAVGVNLPCYLVVIKGTVTWTDKGLQEYSDLEIMQMLGRAGRPQFETSACAVILTRPEKEQHYKKMVSGEEILESCLHLNLIDHLNSEVGLGTVTDITSATKWLAGTFLFVRLQKNPRHYQLEGQVEQNAHHDLLESICGKDISLLQEARLVFDGPRFKCTDFGDAMARYYINFGTMKTILAMPPKAKMSEILSTLAHAGEFSDIRFRSGEKGLYKELNGDIGIKFPIKVDIAQNPHKISLLIQSELGGSIFPSHEKWKKHKTQFNADRNMVFSHVNRLIRCIIDCQIYLKDTVSIRHALELARSLAARVWDKSPFQMKQIDSIGEAGVRKLVQVGVTSIETLQNTEPHRIESALGRHPPFGQKVLAKVVEFPNLHVSVKEMGKERRPGQWVKIKFKADVGFVNPKMPTFFRKKTIYVCFLAETSDGKLIDFRRFAAKKLENGQEILLSVQLTKPTTSISCHVMCDEIAGTSRRAELQLEQFPSSYFRIPEQTAPESSKDAAFGIPQEFDDVYGDLDDADMLAVLDNEEGIEVIHDIDDVILDSNKPAKKSLKRTAKKISTEQGEIQPYKEPVQLENGNWTCQHSCKDDGKTCKHPCCAEGVKRPVKPGRKKPAKADPSIKDSADDTARKKSTKSTPFDKAHSQAEGKKQKLMVAGTHETNSSRRRQNSAGIEKEQKIPAPAKVPAHRYEKNTVPKLSFMQTQYGLSSTISEFVEIRADEVEQCNISFNKQPHEQRNKGQVKSSDDVFDFEMDDDLDDLTVEDMISAAEYVEASKQSVFAQKKLVSPKSKFSEVSGVSTWHEGGVLHSAGKETVNEHRMVGIIPSKVVQAGCPSTTSTHTMSGDKDHNSIVTSLGDETDFGAFNAPLTHLAPAATQRWTTAASKPSSDFRSTSKPQGKGLFITGESSSPEKSLSKLTETKGEVEEYADHAVDALFATLEGADYDVANPPAKRQKVGQDHDTEAPIPSPRRMRELQTSSTTALSSFDDHETTRKPLAVFRNGHDIQHPWAAMKEGMVDSHGEVLMTEEEKKRIAKEEQKKKWEGLEDFYEQFGDYVEIVD